MKTKFLILTLGIVGTYVALNAKEPDTLLDAGVSVLNTLGQQISQAEAKHQELKERYGSKHPSVMQAEKEIDHLITIRDAQLKAMPMWSRRDTSEMDDVQLRHMVAVLVERVVELEKQVDLIKAEPKTRIELLDPLP